MQVRLLLFAAHREAVGRRRLEVEVPEGATAEDLYRLVQEKQPALSSLRPYTTFAVNREVVDPSSPLRPGDEVAFLQPVSGG
jgi:molybdopterin converting factor subunit 1